MAKSTRLMHFLGDSSILTSYEIAPSPQVVRTCTFRLTAVPTVDSILTKIVNIVTFPGGNMAAAAHITEPPSILESASALAAQFAPRAAEHDRDATFPFENFDALRDADMLRLTIPRDLGGYGIGLSTTAKVVEEIARGDASTALVLAMHLIYHAVFGRARRWPPSVYERLCRESIDGLALINVMRVEPELGTPARGGLPATAAARTESGWQISGRKIYATGSPILRYYLVWARTVPPGDEAPEVGYFLVPSDCPGVSIVETWDHLGMRATGSHDLVMDHVNLPMDHALDVRPPAAWTAPDPSLAGWNTLVLTALYHGVARAARDWLVGYLHERVPTNLGAPLATLPRFQSAVGEIDALLYASDRLIYGLTAEIDEGNVQASSKASLVKFVATNNAIHAVDIALALIGNPGLSRSNPLERHHRDVLCSRIHSPQDDMITLAAGRQALGIV
jgi:alkylation response protein AidB-like acyl-CoA dehydrogenase